MSGEFNIDLPKRIVRMKFYSKLRSKQFSNQNKLFQIGQHEMLKI